MSRSAWLVSHLLRTPSAYRVYRRLLRGRVGENRYEGVFSSFAEARASLPPSARVGYDNPELASWYRDRLDRVFLEDYPIVFWLQRLAPRSVFDFGGHVGLHYFAWQRLLEPLAELRWQVSEVPAIVEAGRRLAAERGADRLSFTDRPEDSDGADLFLASGSLQYLEPGFLPDLLRGLRRKPPHVIVNKLPVHPSREYVTVQDTGASLHPYTVFSRRKWVAAMGESGYRLVDEWSSRDHVCRVTLHPELEISAYTGACFSQQQNNA